MYNVGKWEEDFRKREKILKKMCEYPYILNRSQMGEGIEPLSKPGSLPRINNSSFIDYNNNSNNNNMRTGLNTSIGGDRSHKNSVIIKQADVLDENRIVLFKKGKQLGDGYFVVEISSNNT